MKIFKEIIPIYDKMNRIMSFGFHNHWRSFCIKMAKYNPNSKILDIGIGTGDFSLQIQRYVKDADVFGIDLLEDMLQKAMEKGLRIKAVVADACFLPFRPSSFDGITLGFVLRHIPIQGFIKEAMRVLKPGGKLIILELSFPKSRVIRFFFKLYLYKVIPFLGKLFGKEDAYLYLGESLKNLPCISEIEEIACYEGAKKVETKTFVFGAIFSLLVIK